MKYVLNINIVIVLKNKVIKVEILEIIKIIYITADCYIYKNELT